MEIAMAIGGLLQALKTTFPRTLFASLRCLALAAACTGVSASAWAAEKGEIVVGQVASFSGQNGADLGLGLKDGIEAYFREVNAQGGINGRTLRLVAKDDKYIAAETVRLTKELIEVDKPIALIGYRGTANTIALVNSGLLSSNKIALVGTLSGAEEIQGANLLFHARTSYADEIGALTGQIQRLNYEKIAVLHPDDTFGKTGLAAVISALAKTNKTPTSVASYVTSANEVGASIKAAALKLAAAQPTAVVMVSVGEPAYAFIREIRDAAPTIALFGISVVNPATVVEKVGLEKAKGIGFSQVFPFPYGGGFPIVTEYKTLLKKHVPNAQPGYFSLEGFIYGKVLVEALRKAGPNPTRESVAAALKKLTTLDVGGFSFKLNPTTNNGSRFIDLTIIDRNGNLIS
jgi:branched-chain amino acid transport system substrate-binding protein